MIAFQGLTMTLKINDLTFVVPFDHNPHAIDLTPSNSGSRTPSTGMIALLHFTQITKCPGAFSNLHRAIRLRRVIFLRFAGS